MTLNLLGTSGTRNIPQDREPEFVERLCTTEMKLWLDQFQGFVSGGSRGWDSIFGETMFTLFPSKRHVVVVPSNLTQVDPWWERHDPDRIWLLLMDDGTSYRDRNIKIVQLSAYLFYCAEYPEDDGHSKRSGTWMTVRLARKKDIPVHGFIINEAKEEAHE